MLHASADMALSRPPDRLLGLQLARGMAALMVVIFHGARGLALPQYLGTNALAGAFEFGHAGVDFFFVLSGFIITHVHYGDLGVPDRLKRYAWRRFTRIFPIYWAITVIYVALGLMAPDVGQRLAPLNMLEFLTLWPLGHQPLVPVAWSLEHEVFFYLAFGLAIWNRKLGWLAVAIGLAPLAAPLIGGTNTLVGGFLLTHFHLQFLMGILAARLLAIGPVPFPLGVSTAGLLLFGLSAVLHVQGVIIVNTLSMAVLYGASATMIVVGIATAEREGGCVLARNSSCLARSPTSCIWFILSR
jgi:exopolysaccharide production protein ExoZ